MKKQTLLAAVAVSTLATAAGAIEVQPTALAGAEVTAAVKIAEETKTAALLTGDIGLKIVPSATAILPSGNSLLKIELQGATFPADVTAGAVVANGACAPTTVVSSGGLKGSSSVTFLVSGLNNCTNALPINALVPALVASDTNVVVTLTTEAGTSIDGGSATTSTKAAPALIDRVSAFSAVVKADTTITQAALSSFTKFTAASNDILGTVAIEADTTVLRGISAGAGNAAQADITKATLTLKGGLATVDAKFGGVAFVEDKTNTSLATLDVATPAAGATSITVAPQAAAGTPPVVPAIVASSYTVDVALDLAADFTDESVTNQALDSITREGSSFTYGWVNSATQAVITGSDNTIRISNIASNAAGPVTVELLANQGGIAASSTPVQLFSSIPARGEVLITGANLEAALGNFVRGDIRLTIEGSAANLVAKRLLVRSNGSVTEVIEGQK